MYLNMETPLEKIEEYIKQSVLQEVNPEGLLRDIKSTKTIFKDLKITNTPALWVYLGNWNIEEEVTNKTNSKATLIYQVEMMCLCNKPDLTESDEQATSIQARIVESVIKNWKRLLDKQMNLQNPSININTGYADGKLKVANKQQKVAIKGVLFEFKFTLDWIRCITAQNITENENNNDDGD